MRLLLHCCCGPCAVEVADRFRCLGDDVTGWFFNPNIHPEQERRQREDTLVAAADAIALPLLPAGPGMGLYEFLSAMAGEGRTRCRACYGLRLGATARQAAEHEFDAFSSTLLISPYQALDVIEEVGKEAGGRSGVDFRFADLRGDYRASCERARELGLYRQNYCGCLFSALDRAERRAGRAVAKGLKVALGR